MAPDEAVVPRAPSWTDAHIYRGLIVAFARGDGHEDPETLAPRGHEPSVINRRDRWIRRCPVHRPVRGIRRRDHGRKLKRVSGPVEMNGLGRYPNPFNRDECGR
jgi:hypothetical protein